MIIFEYSIEIDDLMKNTSNKDTSDMIPKTSKESYRSRCIIIVKSKEKSTISHNDM